MENHSRRCIISRLCTDWIKFLQVCSLDRRTSRHIKLGPSSFSWDPLSERVPVWSIRKDKKATKCFFQSFTLSGAVPNDSLLFRSEGSIGSHQSLDCRAIWTTQEADAYFEHNGIFTKFQSRLPLLFLSSSFHSSIPAIHKFIRKSLMQKNMYI